jgi:hypothetical protein
VDEPLVVCRKCKNSACLIEVLQARRKMSLQLVRCQKICHGPVVGVVIDGRMEWFERVADVRSIASLVKLARKPSARTKVPKQLRKHRVRRRSGRAPRT